LLKRSRNFVEKYYFPAKLLIVEHRSQNISFTSMALHKCKPLCYGLTVHLRNSNKQRLIPAKFYINSASSISSQSARF